jgi:hypothetical protein
MIIALNGYIGSGKDTTGQMIQKLGQEKNDLYMGFATWEIKKFAGKLKQIASLLTGIETEKFEDQEFKKINLPEGWDTFIVEMKGKDGLEYTAGIREEEFYNPDLVMEDVREAGHTYLGVKKRPMTVREFLQKLGTDAIRTGLHHNTWVNAAFTEYQPIGHRSSVPNITQDYIPIYPNWIFTDCRFKNEADTVRQKGGKVIRVVRGEEYCMQWKDYKADKDLSIIYREPGGHYFRARDLDTQELVHCFVENGMHAGDGAERGVDYIVVEKPSSLHPSEISLDDYAFDYILVNNSSKQVLLEKVADMLKELLKHILF